MPENSIINWEEYESITKYIYESLGAHYGIKAIGYGRDHWIKGESGVKHQIDVLTEQINGGHRFLTAIECKYIKQKVSKDTVMKLCEIMQDADIDEGIIVCKSGFTRDTVTYAAHKGIKLVKLWEAGEEELDYKKEMEIGILNIYSKMIRSRINITSIDFGDRTIHLDPATGAVYNWKLNDTSGNEHPLKPLLFAFGDKLKSLNIPLKNSTIEYNVGGNLFLKMNEERIAVEKLRITGFLTVDDVSTGKSFRLTDQVWMIMEELFDKRRLTMSKGGLIWNLPKNDN